MVSVEAPNTHEQPPELEILHLSTDMQFAVRAALEIGQRMVAGRQAELAVKSKLDRTLVSNVDIETNLWFNEQVLQQYGGRATVKGEEVSQDATAPPLEGEGRITWVLDSIDGTGEYVATHRDRRTGDPIDPTKPIPVGVEPELIPDEERTTSTALAMLKDGKLWLSVIYNPFRQQLIIADRDLNGTFKIPTIDRDQADGVALGERLRINTDVFLPGHIRWDQAVWEGAPVDTTRLQKATASPPSNDYSAAHQVAELVLGNRLGVVFAGNTLHDIGPATLIALLAGGLVVKPDGRTVDIDRIEEELEGGIVYTNVVGHPSFIHALQTGERNNLFLVDHEGVRFITTLNHVLEGFAGLRESADEIVRFARTAARSVDRGKIAIRGFGYQHEGWISKQEARQLRLSLETLGMPKRSWKYQPYRHLNGTLKGRVTVRNPDREVAIRTTKGEVTHIAEADLLLTALRQIVRAKVRESALRFSRALHVTSSDLGTNTIIRA